MNDEQSGESEAAKLELLAAKAGDVTDEEIDAAIPALTPQSLPSTLIEKEKEAPAEPSSDIRSIIRNMSTGERIKLALLGNGTARMLLIQDANKLIQQCVLRNPMLTQKEVEEFSRNPNVSDQVLRLISNSKTWMKHYSIKVYLVSNPKTPGDIALKWLRYLNGPELKKLSKSKSVSQLVSTTARKRLQDTEK